MKNLFDYIQEEAATPANTAGMGDPIADDGEGKGTEPIPTAKAKREKPKKKKKGEEE